MSALRRTLVLGILTLPFVACPSIPHEAQRRVRLKAASQGEAFDVVVASLNDRFPGLDPETNRSRGTALTTWLVGETPDRLERRRARASVLWTVDDDVEFTLIVELESSSEKTSFGALDRENPNWVGGQSDMDLEHEIMSEIKERLSTRRIGD